MKKLYLLSAIAGLVLLVTFQNCSQKNFEAGSEVSSSVSITDKTLQLAVPGSRISDVQEQSSDGPIQCPMVMCANPPANCHYEADVTTNNVKDANHCSTGCGRLVCDVEKKICPAIRCQAPEVGCHYAETNAKKDEVDCNVGCGEIICPYPPIKDPPPLEPPVVCPLYKCVAPPEGCHLASITKKDENGCNIGCGEVVCPADDLNPILPIKRIKPVICPMYMCVAPPQIEGQQCEYASGSQSVDKDGCQVGCGIVSCEDNTK